jgi:hypothetical protein
MAVPNGRDHDHERNQEPELPWDVESLIRNADLRSQWTTEEMLSQGRIDLYTFPFTDEEETIDIPPISHEELMSYEEIIF